MIVIKLSEAEKEEFMARAHREWEDFKRLTRWDEVREEICEKIRKAAAQCH
jgi:hypothetical protein